MESAIQNEKNFMVVPSPLVLRSISPATKNVLGTVNTVTHEDILIAVEKARGIQPQWERTTFEDRGKILLKLGEIIYDKADEIAGIISDENGKPRAEALTTEVLPSQYLIQYIAKNAKRMLQDEPINMFIWRMIGKRSYISYKPLGVIGIISPWNYPWGIPVGQVATALMAGNAVVLKPSSTVPMISEKIRELFDQAGFPYNLFQVMQGPGKIGEALIEAHVDRLIFTGSVSVGRHVNTLAAKQLIPTTLELGGKDPMIVLEDADIETAAAGAVWGAFANAGQTCAGVERVYVVEKIYDEFVKKVVEKTRKLRLGPDLNFDVDVGAITTKSQLELIREHVADAVMKGAKILVGGKQRADLPGNYFEPTVMVDVCHSMDVMTEETFGPILPIQKVSDEGEAIRLANDSRYGLTASVWTKDLDRGRHVADQLVTGTVMVNDILFSYGAAETPWGGVKESGIGRTHGRIGLHELVRPLHISVDSFPGIKKPWWYPYNERLYQSLKKGMQFFAGKTIGIKSVSLFNLAKKVAKMNKL